MFPSHPGSIVHLISGYSADPLGPAGYLTHAGANSDRHEWDPTSSLPALDAQDTRMQVTTSRTFFPAKGRGLADFNLLNAGLAKAPFQCAAKSHHRKNPANSHANAALRSEAKSRGKKILLIPMLIPGLAGS